ncbi:MAG: transporter permease [Subtercola sp.]|nr:transporter permease [Subtercola sp.]
MILRRLLLTIPILIGTSIIVFAILRLIPGDPAAAILGSNATPDMIVQVRSQLGLDQPIYQQFVTWITGIVQGDFGHDYITNQSITEELAVRLPVTLELAAFAFILALLFAVPLGVISAVRQGGWLDRAVRAFAVFTIAIPDFVFGILGILVFALALSVVPSSGFVPISAGLGDNLRSLAVPAVALALGLGGVLIRVTRSAMLDVLNADYVRFAKASGFGAGTIVFRYALRNASVPIVTVIGLQLGYLLGGTVVVEQLFGLPGVGQLIVQAMLSRNYPVVQACILVFVVAFIVANLATDLLYAVLNPRLRKAGAA